MATDRRPLSEALHSLYRNSRLHISAITHISTNLGNAFSMSELHSLEWHAACGVAKHFQPGEAAHGRRSDPAAEPNPASATAALPGAAATADWPGGRNGAAAGLRRGELPWERPPPGQSSVDYGRGQWHRPGGGAGLRP